MTTPRSAIPDQSWSPVLLPDPLLEPDLLAGSPVGLAHLGRLVTEVTRAAAAGLRRRGGPLPAIVPEELARRVEAQLPDGVLPEVGGGPTALVALGRWYAEGSVDLSDPATAAHLQPPALSIAAAADVLANAFNASVDTWDSGPYAVELERKVIRALADLAGFGPGAGGVLTPGGTASNLQALLIARDLVVSKQLGVNPGSGSLTGLGPRLVVPCSELAHFSVARSCAVLGLGEEAVVPVPTDDRHRMRPEALDAALAGLGADTLPIAVVATAGTTDYGTVDPLPEIAGVARDHGVRMHVDAAYGGGALFSRRLAPLLAGLDAADTVTIDLHKTAWQPAAASALLVADAGDFAPTDRRVAYLNPDDDGAAGYDGLLDRSLQTTRRADALKVAATFLALGRGGLGAMLDACHDLACHAERVIAAHPRLELTAGAVLTTVPFRFLPARSSDSDAVNAALRRRLLRRGTALVGRTDVAGPDGRPSVRLKLTLLNPQARTQDIDALLAAIVGAGEEEDSQ